ncbi:armadillo-type protein [Gaertneriomyces semiglobifer]|nr:armadillo-type protein [Gaertneriomyces semiglobifer]
MEDQAVKRLNTTEGNNRFRFQSFRERVKTVNIDVVHRITRQDEPEEEQFSYFKDGIDKWTELNCTAHFSLFLRDVKPYSQSLVQVLYHKAKIVPILIEHFATPGSLAYEPLLDLTVLLAKDLGDELNEYFGALVESITALLPNADLNLTEAIFTALAYLYKYQARYLVASIIPTFDRLVPLFTHNKDYIRRFAAESFGFLLRRVPKDDTQHVYSHIVRSFSQNPTPEYAEGLSLVFFEAMKHIKGAVHSRAGPMLRSLLMVTLVQRPDPEVVAPYDVLYRLFVLLGEHARADTLADLWRALLSVSTEKLPASDLRVLIRLMHVWVVLRKGRKIHDRQEIFRCTDGIAAIVCQDDGDEDLWSTFSEFVAGLFTAASVEEILTRGKGLVDCIFAVANVSRVLLFVELLRRSQWDHFGQIILPRLLLYMPPRWADNRDLFCLFLARLLNKDFSRLISTVPHSLRSSQDLLRFPAANAKNSSVINTEVLASISEGLVAVVNETLTTCDDDERNTCISRAGAHLTCLQYFAADFESVFVMSSEFLNGFVNNVRADASETYWFQVSTMAGLIIRTITDLGSRNRKNAALTKLHEVIIGKLLPKATQNQMFLAAVAEYLAALRLTSDAAHLLDTEQLQTTIEVLRPNLASPFQSVRLHSLEILNTYDQLSLRPVHDSAFKGVCPVVDICLRLERMENTVATVREKAILIRKLESIILSKTLPIVYLDLPIRYLLGLLGAPFTPLWSEAIKALCSIGSAEGKALWSLVEEMLSDAPMATDNLSYMPIEDQAPKEQDAQNSQLHCADVDRWDRLTAQAAKSLNDISGFLRDILGQSDHRFDAEKFGLNLIKLLGGLPKLVERNSAAIMPLFFALISMEDIGSVMDVDEGNLATRTVEIQAGQRQKVTAYVTLFSKVPHPSKLHESGKLYSVCMDLLCNGDKAVQQAALECILGWKQAGPAFLADVLRDFTDDEKFRDTLSMLSMDDVYANVNTQDRAPLMQILVRLLYGKLISRRGRSSAATLKSRRRAILAAFTKMEEDVLGILIELMVRPFTRTDDEGELIDLGRLKKQIGFLTAFEDLIKQLKSLLIPFLPRLIGVLLGLLQSAERLLGSLHNGNGIDGAQEKNLREVRQLGIRRLRDLFEADLEFDFEKYMEAIFRCVIVPRLTNFTTENTQAPSGVLELIATWSRNGGYAMYLVDYSPELLGKVFDLLSAKKVHATVVSCVLGILESLLQLEHNGNGFVEAIIRPRISSLLVNVDTALSVALASGGPLRMNGDAIPARIVHVLCNLSTYVTDGTQAAHLVDLILPYTKRPARAVPEAVKVQIVRILVNFLPVLPAVHEGALESTTYYATASQLCSILESVEGRQELARLFGRLAKLAPELRVVAEVIQGLSAMSSSRIDEPDYNTRFDTFKTFSHELYLTLTPVQCLPVLHTLIFNVHDKDEFSIRSAASFAISQVVLRISTTKESADDWMNLLIHVIFPAVKRGLRVNTEVIRAEFVNILGLIVKTFPEVPHFTDMVVLLAGGDEEASFFENIYHLQMHRRLRALRRFADVCMANSLSATNVSNVFVPIIAHFIFDEGEKHDHNLVNEGIAALAACATVMTWGQYWALMKRVLNAMTRRANLEKTLIRLLIRLLDAFHFPMELGEDVVVAVTEAAVVPSSVKKLIESGIDNNDELRHEVVGEEVEAFQGDEDGEESDDEDVETTNTMEVDSSVALALAATRVHDAVTGKLLPSLQTYLEKDEPESIVVRVPIALAVAKVLLRLPSKSLDAHLPKLITTMCNFLKSRGQEIRDTTRDTLVKIAALLGSRYFPFILKELERVLTRGYQLHVLGYTLHSLLVHFVPSAPPGTLDACMADIVRVCANDIFGEVGMEREIEELKGKMREIKTTKSFDSFELISKVITFNVINVMLLPLKELMMETNNAGVIRKLNEVLRRIALGLNTNDGVATREMMIFIHGLLGENLPLAQMKSASKKEQTPAEKNFMVQLKRSGQVEALKYFQANAHLFIEFGLSLLLTALRADKVDTRDPAHLGMLDPLVELIGRSLYSEYSTVSLQALRILTLVAKAPLPKLRESMPAIVKRLFEIIRKSLATNDDLIQATFRLMSTIIRECDYVEISQTQLLALVEIIRGDVESQEPERQTVIFSLIRALLSRKLVAKEVYDLMDIVNKVMVTSQSAQIRDLCRQTSLQFLLEYPHGMNRLRKHFNYLIKNLSYEYESGRESVLEMMSGIVTKFNDETLFEFGEMLFVALVLCLVNDDAAKCRRMAGTLVVALIKRMDAHRMEKIITLVNTWFSQESQPHLQRTAAQVAGLILEATGDRQVKWVPLLLQHLQSVLEAVTRVIDQDSSDEEETNWEIAYYGLNTFSKLIAQFPSSFQCEPVWLQVRELMTHPHQWVRLAAARLIGVAFASVNAATREFTGRQESGSVFVLLADDASLKALGDAFYTQLDSDILSVDLAKQVVKNLFFLGKCLFEQGRSTPVAMEMDEEAVAEDVLDDEDDVEDVEDGGNGASENANPSTMQIGETKRYTLLRLSHRLAYLARSDAAKKRGTLVRASVFQWFAAMVSYISPEQLQPYLMVMVSTLYRTAKDETAKGKDAEELRLLANDILNLVQKQVGTSAYLEVFNRVHFKVERVRRERREKRSVQAVIDPEALARRKAQKHSMKRASRKRKAEEFSKLKIRSNIVKKRRAD